jgi:uncharacterized membrane protein HdeD (DUF308 family)
MSNVTGAETPTPDTLPPGVLALRPHSGWIIAFGVALIVIGAVALGSVVAATIATVWYVGVLMLIAAGAEIVLAFRTKTWGKFLLWAALGLLYGVAGVFALINPLLAASALTLLLGAALIATGAMRIYLGLQMKEGAPWGWVVASGVITMLLGLIIVVQWPISSLYTLGIFLGIDLIFAGLGWTGIGVSLKTRHGAL